jgi:hypothetical protein
MNSWPFWFIVCSLILLGISCGFTDQSGEKNKGQSDPGRLLVKFSFRANYDPGHGGSSKTWLLELKNKKYVVNYYESRSTPAPGEKDFRLAKSSMTEERTEDEAKQFFNLMVNDLKIDKLESLKAKVLLHPTFYDFEIQYADGRIHRLEYVVEAGNHLDDRYRRLVEECGRFFGVE